MGAPQVAKPHFGPRADSGHRMGAWHQNAKLSDDDVRHMRYDRRRWGMTYKELALKYGCGESTARDIVKYWTRADLVDIPIVPEWEAGK